MLIVAILSDVAAVNTQQWMMQKQGVPPMSMMLRQNFCSLLGSLVLMFFFGDTSTLLAKAARNPVVLPYACAVGLSTAAAVWCTTHLIHEAGSVVQVGVSTLRKLLTVALSYALFPKPLTALHLFAILMVAAGLLLPSCGRRRRSTGALAQRKGCSRPRLVPCNAASLARAFRLGSGGGSDRQEPEDEPEPELGLRGGGGNHRRL